MSKEQEATTLGCPIDDLPVEILAFILNGHVRSPRRASEGADMFPLYGDARDHWVDRPLLDGRWRFAARAVCRAWRVLIENPSLIDAVALDAYQPFASYSLLRLQKCPKWATGRVLCLSAAADIVAAHSACWAQDPEAVFDWCQRNAGATRKQAIAVLVASGVPWAADAIVNHHWPLVTFPVQDDPISVEHCSTAVITTEPAVQCRRHAETDLQCAVACGNEGCIPAIGDDDDGKCAQTARNRPYGWGADLCAAAAYQADADELIFYAEWRDDCGDVAGFLWTLLAIALRRGLHATFCAIEHRFACRMSEYDAVMHAITGNHPDLVATLLCGRTEVDDKLWDDAASVSDPACLGRLLDLLTLPTPDAGDKVAEWMMRAIKCDRPGVFALCDARGIALDAVEVAKMAACCGSVGVLAYMVARGQRLFHASPTTVVPLDLAALTWEAMTDTYGYSSDARAIEWLCDVAGYAPRRDTDDLRRLIEHAYQDDDDGGGPERIVYVAERWPDAFAALPKSVLCGAFGHCVGQARKPYEATARLAKVLHAHIDPIDRDAVVQDLGLWGVVVSNLTVESMRAFRTGSLVRTLCLLARGERPYADDTGAARNPPKPCECTQDSSWRHRDVSPTRNVCAKDPADMGGPCDDATWMMLAPLRRWCVARPIHVGTIFPGWVPPTHEPAPPYTMTAISDLGRSQLVAWLDAHDFLLVD
ncbi:hypothetical protein pqer_cds_1015 [Pandoravirus quercus]|uniref:F-box incomplete domain containing protein n=1 Tax=Pandoravirus quercus TaxID=2107709 RepID=A0A2U7UAG4_9VIRU|nr:hypothetical protein pqer_cds_1015 [Pandoravirus quercus]AVK75437.1 hypothetical protein pqer_cds_1015 [Pandoravirus quercus]